MLGAARKKKPIQEPKKRRFARTDRVVDKFAVVQQRQAQLILAIDVIEPVFALVVGFEGGNFGARFCFCTSQQRTNDGVKQRVLRELDDTTHPTGHWYIGPFTAPHQSAFGNKLVGDNATTFARNHLDRIVEAQAAFGSLRGSVGGTHRNAETIFFFLKKKS